MIGGVVCYAMYAGSPHQSSAQDQASTQSVTAGSVAEVPANISSVASSTSTEEQGLAADEIPPNTEAETDVVALQGPRSLTPETTDVFVCDRPVPINLVLSSYNPRHWNIWLQPGTQLANIVLTGFGPQDVAKTTPQMSDAAVFTISAAGLKDVPLTTYEADKGNGWASLFGEAPDQIRGAVDWIGEKLSISSSTLQSFQVAQDSSRIVIDSRQTYDPSTYQFRSSLLPSQDSGLRLLQEWNATPLPDYTVKYLTTDIAFTNAAYTSRTVRNGKGYFEARLSIPAGQSPQTGLRIDFFTTGVLVGTQTDFEFRSADESAAQYSDFTKFSYMYSLLSDDPADTAVLPVSGLHDGDVIGVAADFDDGYIQISKNGVWQPGKIPIEQNLDYVIFFSAGGTMDDRSRPGDSWDVNFGQSSFVYQSPSGFGAYDELRGL